MGSYEPYYSSKLHGFLLRAGINIVVNPFANSLIQGRLDVYPKRRGFAQLKELLAAGVNVSLGNDVIMDPWYSLGRADMVEAASLALHFTYMSGLEEIPEMSRGRGVMLQRYKDGGLADAKIFNFAGGLSWRQGESRTRTETDLANWLGARATAGRIVPTGFPKSNRFG